MADGERLAPFDLPPELSPGSPAAGPAGLLGELGEMEGAVGAEVAAATTPALDPGGSAGMDGPAAEVPAEVPVAVHPAVTRTGTSTSAAAIRRMRPSSPIHRRQGPV